MLSEPFARVLTSRRAELNAQFAESRRRFPALDASAFADFLRDLVDPVVRAVDAVRPDRVEHVALAAYDVALELVGQRLVEGDARGASIRACWQRVLPAVPQLVAADPSHLLAALSNAAHQVAATPGAHPDRWAADVSRLGEQCATPEELLRIGQVAAWRAGLAHYRPGAIAAATALAEPLALAAVDAPSGARWDEIVRGLTTSEWFNPAAPEVASNGGVREVAAIGAFRGFGGLFGEPPRVTVSEGQLCVTSAGDAWLLTADRFGATFHRASPMPALEARIGAGLPTNLRLTPDGLLSTPAGTLQLGAAGRVTSTAATATTLAVTWSLSHRVTLAALA